MLAGQVGRQVGRQAGFQVHKAALGAVAGGLINLHVCACQMLLLEPTLWHWHFLAQGAAGSDAATATARSADGASGSNTGHSPAADDLPAAVTGLDSRQIGGHNTAGTTV